MDFDNVIQNYKQTDVDPREIVLLFREAYETSQRYLGVESLARKPTYFINKIIEQALMNMN